jgi:outer membrane protein
MSPRRAPGNESRSALNKFVEQVGSGLALTALLGLGICHAEPLPLWEVGAGVGALNLPDYRGSDTRSTYAVPIPYFIYRGDFLKADREGVRGTLYEGDKVELNVSLNGTLPVNSDDNSARRGMADLRPTVELGPNLNVHLWQSANEKMRLDLRAPVRTAITVESSPRQIGWVFLPNLNLRVDDPTGMPGWRLGLQAGPVFSNREYNSYFYSVGAADATATRPAYSAAGGYSGSQFTMALSKRFRRYLIGGFMRYDALKGAVFEDSPLLRKSSGVAAGFAVAWVFGESSQLVDSPE